MSVEDDWYNAGFHDGALAVLKDLACGDPDKLIERMGKWADKLEKLQPGEKAHV